MVSFFLLVGNFFSNPLVRGIGALLAVCLLVWGTVSTVKGYWQGVRNDITVQVRQEYEVRDLKQAVKDAEADKQFWKEQAEKREQEVDEWRAETAKMADRVQNSRTTIREGIANGTLKDGKIGPVVDKTLDEIDRMENERATK
jgi:hypothetical protein